MSVLNFNYKRYSELSQQLKILDKSGYARFTFMNIII